MAFPVVETTNESSTNTAGTSHVVNMPASIAASDLVIICLDKGSTAATVNAHADWTELLDENAANGLYIAYRVGPPPTGATSTLVTSASTRSAEITFRISGAQDPAVQAPQIGTTATGTSATPNPPTVTPTGGAKDYLFIAFAGMAGEEADDDTWANTPPTNYTPSPPLQKSCGTAGTNLGGLITAASRQLNAASDDPGTFGVDVSAAWRAQTIVIHPAPPNVNGTADGSFTFSGTGTGTVDHTGTLVGTYSFTGTSSGVRGINGTTADAYNFAGSASGVRGVVGSTSNSYDFTGTASGVVTQPGVAGTADGSFNFSGAAVGVRNSNGQITANFGFSGTATGQKTVTGQAISTLSFASTAVGTKTVSGQTQSTLSFGGTASGVRGTFGQAVSSLSFTGSALGVVQGQVNGTAQGDYSFTSSVNGIGQSPILGTAQGSFAFASGVLGVRELVGVAASSITFVGSANGQIVTSSDVLGTANCSLGFVSHIYGYVPMPPVVIDVTAQTSDDVTSQNHRGSATWKANRDFTVVIGDH